MSRRFRFDKVSGKWVPLVASFSSIPEHQKRQAQETQRRRKIASRPSTMYEYSGRSDGRRKDSFSVRKPSLPRLRFLEKEEEKD